jgi:hypothetical protein
MRNIVLQIDYTQLSHVEQYILGTLIVCLIGGIVWLATQLIRERQKSHDISLKAIEALGANNEIIRNNTDILNEIKAKLK